MLTHGQHIGEDLGRVKLIGQPVVDRDAGPLRQLFDDGLPEAAICDGVIDPPQHACGILDGFLLPICEPDGPR